MQNTSVSGVETPVLSLSIQLNLCVSSIPGQVGLDRGGFAAPGAGLLLQPLPWQRGDHVAALLGGVERVRVHPEGGQEVPVQHSRDGRVHQDLEMQMQKRKKVLNSRLLKIEKRLCRQPNKVKPKNAQK